MSVGQSDTGNAKFREESLNALCGQFDAYVKRLPPEFQEASSRLGLMFDIPAKEMRTGWFGHFSPLALLYPRFQLDSLADIPKDVMEQASLAHVQLLVHAVIEDRILDGQFRPSREDLLFTKQLFTDAIHTLTRMQDGESQERNWIRHLLGAYTSAQCHSYGCPATLSNERNVSHTIRSVVCGRGYLGLIATMTLAQRYVPDARTVRTVRNAFDALMLGMQWTDDLKDWQEDLTVGDINLLLHALRESGLDSYGHPDNGLRIANVGHALVERGILEKAVHHASRWFDSAALRQRLLGCGELASAIDQKARMLGMLRQEQFSVIEREICAVAIATGR